MERSTQLKQQINTSHTILNHSVHVEAMDMDDAMEEWTFDELAGRSIMPLNNTEALLEHAASNQYGLVMEEEDLEDDIRSDYVEETMNTPLCDFGVLLERLQLNISKQHQQRIVAGKESLKRINANLKDEHVDDDLLITDNDLNDLLDSKSYSVPFLIKIPEFMEKWKKDPNQFGTLIEAKSYNLKKNKYLAHTPERSINVAQSFGDRNLQIEMYNDEQEYQNKSDMYRRSNADLTRQQQAMPQLSASMLAAAARKQAKRNSTSPKKHQPLIQVEERMEMTEPPILISSVKSLAPTATPSSPSRKGYVPILPKPPPPKEIAILPKPSMDDMDSNLSFVSIFPKPPTPTESMFLDSPLDSEPETVKVNSFQNMTVNQSSFSEKEIGCGICERNFDSRTELQLHLSEDHPEMDTKILIDPDFRCGKCLRRFEDSFPLTLHAYSCKSTKPTSYTVLELAKGLLECDVCSKTHNSIDEAQNCYISQSPIILRCLLCRFIGVSKKTFVQHLKTYHDRKDGKMSCQICSENGNQKVYKPSSFMEHLEEVHLTPALNDAKKGIRLKSPSPPPTKKNKASTKARKTLRDREKEEEEREKRTKESKETHEPAIPPGCVLNTTRLITTSKSVTLSSYAIPVMTQAAQSRPQVIPAFLPPMVASPLRSSTPKILAGNRKLPEMKLIRQEDGSYKVVGLDGKPLAGEIKMLSGGGPLMMQRSFPPGMRQGVPLPNLRRLDPKPRPVFLIQQVRPASSSVPSPTETTEGARGMIAPTPRDAFRSGEGVKLVSAQSSGVRMSTAVQATTAGTTQSSKVGSVQIIRGKPMLVFPAGGSAPRPLVMAHSSGGPRFVNIAQAAATRPQEVRSPQTTSVRIPGIGIMNPLRFTSSPTRMVVSTTTSGRSQIISTAVPPSLTGTDQPTTPAEVIDGEDDSILGF